MSKSKKYMLIFVGVLVFALFAINGFSYAKYASKKAWNYYLQSKGFYFNSNDLGLTEVVNVNNMWNGENIYFSINNFKSTSEVAETDITYTVTCILQNNVNGDTCLVNGQSSYNGTLSRYEGCINNKEDNVNVSNYNHTTCETNGYEWVNSPATSNLYFNVVNNGRVVSDATAIITVTTNYPYTKTLTGKYVLHRVDSIDENVTLEHTSYEDYESIVLSNLSSTNSCVELSFDTSKVHLDIDSNLLSSYELDSDDYLKKIKLTINANSSTRLIFYKVNASDTITNNDFTLINSSGC